MQAGHRTFKLAYDTTFEPGRYARKQVKCPIVRTEYKAYDIPVGRNGHTWRWTRDPAPIRLTVANGEAIFANGETTGARPGQMPRLMAL